jgi:uncharacterized small protein (DUF1192 family)
MSPELQTAAQMAFQRELERMVGAQMVAVLQTQTQLTIALQEIARLTAESAKKQSGGCE